MSPVGGLQLCRQPGKTHLNDILTFPTLKRMESANTMTMFDGIIQRKYANDNIDKRKQSSYCNNRKVQRDTNSDILQLVESQSSTIEQIPTDELESRVNERTRRGVVISLGIDQLRSVVITPDQTGKKWDIRSYGPFRRVLNYFFVCL